MTEKDKEDAIFVSLDVDWIACLLYATARLDAFE